MNERSVRCLGLILTMLAWPVLAQLPPTGSAAADPAGTGNWQPVSGRTIFAAGDGDGLYVVKPGEQNGKPAFEVRFRARTAAEFGPGYWYLGVPEETAIYQGWLVVFTAAGGCFGYDQEAVVSLPRLPENHTLAAVAAAENRLTIAMRQSNGLFLYELKDRTRWQPLHTEALPLTGWAGRTVTAACLPAGIRLFGWNREGRLETMLWSPDEPGEPAALVMAAEGWNASPPDRLRALAVNRSVRLIWAGQEEGAVSYRVGWLEEERWLFSPPLRENAQNPLTTAPGQIDFASSGQMIAATSYAQDDKLYLGYYTPSGQVSLALEPVVTRRAAPQPLFNWLFRQELVFLGMVFLGMIFFNRRTEAFAPKLESLPPDVTAAHPVRRMLAFLADGFLVFLLGEIIAGLILRQRFTPEQLMELTQIERLSEQLSTGQVPPHVMEMIAWTFMTVGILFLLYFAICEGLFSFTPGKRLLGIVVLDYQGRPISPGQALIRNGLRLFDNNLFLLLFTLPLLFITPRRQRPGDLAARTMVARATPELIGRILEQNKRLLMERSQERRNQDDEMP